MREPTEEEREDARLESCIARAERRHSRLSWNLGRHMVGECGGDCGYCRHEELVPDEDSEEFQVAMSRGSAYP